MLVSNGYLCERPIAVQYRKALFGRRLQRQKLENPTPEILIPEKTAARAPELSKNQAMEVAASILHPPVEASSGGKKDITRLPWQMILASASAALQLPIGKTAESSSSSGASRIFAVLQALKQPGSSIVLSTPLLNEAARQLLDLKANKLAMEIIHHMDTQCTSPIPLTSGHCFLLFDSACLLFRWSRS